jgi:hypothetical protein
MPNLKLKKINTIYKQNSKKDNVISLNNGTNDAIFKKIIDLFNQKMLKLEN